MSLFLSITCTIRAAALPVRILFKSGKAYPLPAQASEIVVLLFTSSVSFTYLSISLPGLMSILIIRLSLLCLRLNERQF